MARSRRLLLRVGAAFALALSFGWGDTAATARPILFAGNARDATVTVIDATTLKAIGTLTSAPDGLSPQDPLQAIVYPFVVQLKGPDFVQGLALSPDGRTLYVSRGYLGDVVAVDLATRKIAWRSEVAGLRADHLAISADGRRLFVSALTANEVQTLNTANGAVTGSFATGDWSHVLELTPDGAFIVNGSLGNQLLPSGVPTRFQLTFADPRTLEVKRTLSFDAGVRPFAFSPDGSLAYVQFSYFNGFKVVDAVSGRIVKTVNLPIDEPGRGLQPSQYPNQAAHHGIDLSRDGALICDAATISNYVALVDRGSLATAAIVPVGDQPADAITSSDGRYCFVSNRGPGAGGNSVSVISYAARREVARITAGQGPQELVEGDIPDSVLEASGFKLAPLATPTAKPKPRMAHHKHHRRARRRPQARRRR